VLRSLVAFVNTAGGTVLVGVEDRTRHVRGINEPLDLEERLANLISDYVTPRLACLSPSERRFARRTETAPADE
jgi:predicted HTH transcriptional regulator